MTKRKKTKTFLVDDHIVVLQGIRAVLEDSTAFEIIGHTTDGLNAVNQVKDLKPDIVVMDISMPSFNGIEATYEIRKSCPSVKIIVYSMSSDKQHVLSLFKAGISGYVLKEDPLDDLIRALETVIRGGTYYSRISRTTHS
ncbi:response regulator transcription factor [Thermodesulfobacteriota bacterium]